MLSSIVDREKSSNPSQSCWVSFVETRLLVTPARRRMFATLLGAAVVLSMFADLSLARPMRGPTKWSVILCTTSDAPPPPTDRAHYEQLFNEWLSKYWRSVSYENVYVEATVKGWYKMSATTTQLRGPIHPECSAAGVTCTGIRGDAERECRSAASSDPTDPYTPPSDHNVAHIVYPDIDLYGRTPGYAFLSWNSNFAGIGHESGHALGMDHSFSNDSRAFYATTEYDDSWDVMSCYTTCFMTPIDRTSPMYVHQYAPIGTTGWQIDRMGWLPRSRIVVMGADGRASRTIILAALNRPTAVGALLVRIPFNPSDLSQHYTVEFRRAVDWDAIIKEDRVLIHEVKPRPAGTDGNSNYVGYLIRDLTDPDRIPVKSLSANGITITVDRIDAASNQAQVTITTEMVDKCVLPYVWRLATPSDRVCVPLEARRRTGLENRLGPLTRTGVGDACKADLVWREAVPGDRVCVPRSNHMEAQRENAAAPARRNPARLAYGPNTCKPGYVWRNADDFDWVCVAPTDRNITQEENRLAGSRTLEGGRCLAGFVWREAFPGDRVCVPPARREQAQRDNREAQTRLSVL
jgi:hypothetical protein